jgi:autotransporter-associated beta strand protein
LALSVDTSLSVAALRQAILDGVDPLPALAGKTVSGGRLNAARTLALVVPPLAVEYITTLPGAEVIDATVRSDARQLVIRGGGRVVLTAANQHTGGTVVEAGEVIIRNPAALGSGALEVRAGAKVTLDVASNEIAVGALKLADSGLLDLGYGRVTLEVSAASVQDGLGLAKVQDLLRDAYGAKWVGAGGFATRTAGLVAGGGLAYLDNGGGSITVGFAAKGDSNLDGVVDILDASNLLGGGKINAGPASTWLEGDFNYDGVVDLLDVADFVSTGLFEAGSYRPLHAAQPEITSTTLSAIDAAFMAFAAESAVSTGTSTTKKRRFASMS